MIVRMTEAGERLDSVDALGDGFVLVAARYERGLPQAGVRSTAPDAGGPEGI
ncbi:hypothetical protein [Plantactinospora soyae]|uniref:hypothetical protein n=1 Tax=Plantactinospora soyae TaxID=1544732 RepID=UPI0017896BE8|nr:hypothetical protein [Plantactinospora soyae]